MAAATSTTGVFEGRRRPGATLDERVALVAGFLAVAAGALLAHGSPATGYELSVYRATPPGVWLAAGTATACALYVLVRGDGWARAVALGLGGLTFAFVVGLPVVRGYEFFGSGDALSHLGWVRDVLTGRMDAYSLLYPGGHVTATLVHVVTGVAVPRALMLVVVAYTLLFALSTTVAVWTLSARSGAVVVGALTAAMVLPVNNISAFLVFHPSTLASLFVPGIFAALVVYLKQPDGPGRGLPFAVGLLARVRVRSPTAAGVLVALGSVAITLVHPQQAANVLFAFTAVAAAQVVRRWRRPGADHLRPVYAQTAFLALVFALWSLDHELVFAASESFASTLLFDVGEASNAIAQRGGSLQDIGASLGEMFVKLFLVSVVYLGVAGVYGLGLLAGRFRERTESPTATLYIAIGVVPVFGLFGLYLFANYGTMYFRHLAFVMAVVSVLGALGLYHLAGAVRDRLRGGGRPVVTGLTVAALVAMLLASAMILFPSPYVYKSTPHVSEMQLAGYETAFDRQADDVEMYGIRLGPDRYRDAITGTGDLNSGYHRRSTAVPPEALPAPLPAILDRRLYVVVSEKDVLRETRTFDGLRYTSAWFDGVGTHPRTHRVATNGEVSIYLVDGAGT